MHFVSSSFKTMSGFKVLDAEGFLKHVRHLDKPLFISYSHNIIHQSFLIYYIPLMTLCLYEILLCSQDTSGVETTQANILLKNTLHYIQNGALHFSLKSPILKASTLQPLPLVSINDCVQQLNDS